MRLIQAFQADESGATAIEYGLIAALVAMVAIVGLQLFGDAMLSMYTGNEGSLDATIKNAGS